MEFALWGKGISQMGHWATISCGNMEWFLFIVSSWHYSDFIMSVMTSQITRVSIFYSTVCSGTDKKNHQSSTSLAFVRGIHRWPVNSLHKGPVMRKMFPFDDIMHKCDFFVISNWLSQLGCIHMSSIMQQLKSLWRSYAKLDQRICSSLVLAMVCCLFGAKPLPKPIKT